MGSISAPPPLYRQASLAYLCIQSHPIQPAQTNPTQPNPIQSNPIWSDPVKSDLIRSNPIRSDPIRFRSNPIQSSQVQSNSALHQLLCVGMIVCGSLRHLGIPNHISACSTAYRSGSSNSNKQIRKALHIHQHDAQASCSAQYYVSG